MSRRASFAAGRPVGQPPHRRSRSDLPWLAMRLFRAIGALERETVRRHGLDLASYEVLVELAGEPARGPLALARTLAAEKSSVVEALNSLVAAGYVRATGDRTEDRTGDRTGDRSAGRGADRFRAAEVTPAGLAVVQAVVADLQRVEDDLLGEVEPADREVFFAVLQNLAGGPLRDMPLSGLHTNRPRPFARAKRFLKLATDRTRSTDRASGLI